MYGIGIYTLMAILDVYNVTVTVLHYTVKKRPLDKEEQSDSNNLYDDVTPTPKKVAKSRKVVKKSQISAPILHNSSVSPCVTLSNCICAL